MKIERPELIVNIAPRLTELNTGPMIYVVVASIDCPAEDVYFDGPLWRVTFHGRADGPPCFAYPLVDEARDFLREVFLDEFEDQWVEEEFAQIAVDALNDLDTETGRAQMLDELVASEQWALSDAGYLEVLRRHGLHPHLRTLIEAHFDGATLDEVGEMAGQLA